MYEGFQRWQKNATPEERAVIDELIGRKDLLIHVFLAVGRISDQSRGGASGWASDEEIRSYCDFHPILGTFSQELDWDVVYDRQRTDAFEEQYGIPTPVEVMLQHEIFGHVLPALRDPKLEGILLKDKRLKKMNECEALAMENSYRRRIGLREVPPESAGCPSL